MRTYVIVTIVVFALIVLAHALRLILEGTAALTQPIFVVTSIFAGAMAGWGIALVMKRRT